MFTLLPGCKEVMGLDVLGLKVKRRTIQDVTFTAADPGSSKKPLG